jgi:hypothetical protein
MDVCFPAAAAASADEDIGGNLCGNCISRARSRRSIDPYARGV